MGLGEKIRAARKELGLSQRQLCGDQITRNMLSLIESGSARPSMDTLAFLANRLGKPISFFLDETAMTSPNQAVMAQARDAYRQGDWEMVLKNLEGYRGPDGMFDSERWLMEGLAALALADDALKQARKRYAAELLEKARDAMAHTIYGGPELERRRLLLTAKLDPKAAAYLPSMDEELCLRARAALEAGEIDRAGALLDGAADRTGEGWNLLRGDVYFAEKSYRAAAECYRRAEETDPQRAVPRLENCYRELEDFKMAYEYACKRR